MRLLGLQRLRWSSLRRSPLREYGVSSEELIAEYGPGVSGAAIGNCSLR